MKNISKKRIKEIGKSLGVNLTFDKTLDKYSKIVPEKIEQSNKLFANAKLDF